MLKLKEFYKGKKIFITGHTGFKGSWLSYLLLYFGANIKGYSKEAERISLYKALGFENKIDSEYDDIRNLESLKESICKFKPEIVIHMAAQPLVRESYLNPVETYSTNVMGTVNIMESIRFCDTVKSVINVTTDKVYENIEIDTGYIENDKLCGKDPYSNSKSCSELVTYSYKASFFSHIPDLAISTARAGNVIGGGDFSKDRIIPDCIKFASQNKDVIIRNPKSIRPYQHVLDCIYGYLILAKKQYESKGYEGNYNFGPEDKDIISTEELVNIFCKEWGSNQKWITSTDSGPPEANILKLNNKKSKEILGWKPNLNIEKAIKYTVDWSKVYIEEPEKIEKNTEIQIKKYLSL